MSTHKIELREWVVGGAYSVLKQVLTISDPYAKEMEHNGYIYKIRRDQFSIDRLRAGYIFINKPERKAILDAFPYNEAKFYVYEVFWHGEPVHYVGATSNPRQRCLAHRKKWKGCYLCILRVTTAAQVADVENEEIDALNRRCGMVARNRVRSAYNSGLPDLDPTATDPMFQ